MENIQDNNLLEQYWQEQIKLKQESGLSRSAYCKKHNLSYHTFAYWEYKKHNKKVSQLLPVKLIKKENSNLQSKSKTLCTLLLNGNHELNVYDQSVLPLIITLLK